MWNEGERKRKAAYVVHWFSFLLLSSMFCIATIAVGNAVAMPAAVHTASAVREWPNREATANPPQIAPLTAIIRPISRRLPDMKMPLVSCNPAMWESRQEVATSAACEAQTAIAAI